MKKIFAFVFFIGVLSSCSTSQSNMIDGYEYVDLGLPSGLKWATCNVGASAPTEVGVEYLMCDPRDVQLVTNVGNFDVVQNYDVASIMWSDKWRRPHDYEFHELLKYCEWKYEKINGQDGYKVVGPNGNSIFFPMNNYQTSASNQPSPVYISKETKGIGAYIIDGMECTDLAPSALVHIYMSVRPVSDYGVSLDKAPKDKMMREFHISQGKIGSHAGREWVDMGLPSGLKWATCNIGASSPEDAGDYINPCDDNNPLLTVASIDSAGEHVNPYDGRDDWVLAKGDGNWGIPGWKAFSELKEYCTFSWEIVNGHGGYRVTPKQGGPSIFLPAAGYLDDGVTHSFGTDGIYMGEGLLCFCSDEDSSGCGALYRNKGALIIDGQSFCVRPVLMPEPETDRIPPYRDPLNWSLPAFALTTSEKERLFTPRILRNEVYEIDNFQMDVCGERDFEPVVMLGYVLHNEFEIVDDVEELFINLEDSEDLGVEIMDYVEVQEEEVQEEAIPFQLVEEKPSFQGGDANAFSKWVNQRLVYPEIAKESGVQGRVTLQFTVEKDGRVTNVRVLRGVDPQLDREAVRVVQSSPKWKPGKQRDRSVPVTYTFPVIFQLR